MAPVFANAVNLQRDCPLFSKIPQEIRDKIFDLVVTPHEEKHVPYPKKLRYSRPGFRHSDRKLSTTLLRCCQLIYCQTFHLPAEKYVQVDWICAGHKGHENKDGSCWTRSSPTALQNLHLFTTKRWLGMTTSLEWARYTQLVATHTPNLRYLKITLEHDNDPFEAEHDIIPNAKKRGLSRMLHIENSDPFEEWSWGNQLRAFESLDVMELEIETLEENRKKFDLNIAKAAGWRCPLAKGKELVFNPRKIKWEGWHGPSLGERVRASPLYLPATFYGSPFSFDQTVKPVAGFHKDPVAARKRLIEAGVDFKATDDAPEIKNGCETYCVATLVFEATQSAQIEQKTNECRLH